jgi:hypothetical protein
MVFKGCLILPMPKPSKGLRNSLKAFLLPKTKITEKHTENISDKISKRHFWNSRGVLK